MLLAITQSAQQKAQPHQAVERDYYHRKNRIAPQRRIIRAMQHSRRDHDHFDANRR